MIELTQAELKSFSIITVHLNVTQAELNATLAAQRSYVELLEAKYKAKLNPETGMFEPIAEEESKASEE